MAMTSGRSSGSYSYSYTTTETYTLQEALAKVVAGTLSPGEVFAQLPAELKSEFDRIAKRSYGNDFSSLNIDQERRVVGDFLNRVRKAEEMADKPLTLVEALQLAIEGMIDEAALYKGSPGEIQNMLDELAKMLGGKAFMDGSPEARMQALLAMSAMIQSKAPDGLSNEPSGGSVSVPPSARNHVDSSGVSPGRRNAEYEKALKDWEALPWWKRMHTPRPTPPMGI
jgi:hypothetical protein